jgi:hypothetical protein
VLAGLLLWRRGGNQKFADIHLGHLKMLQLFVLKLNTSIFRAIKKKISISGINI